MVYAGSTAEEVLPVYAPFAMGVIALRLEPRERPVVAQPGIAAWSIFRADIRGIADVERS